MWRTASFFAGARFFGGSVGLTILPFTPIDTPSNAVKARRRAPGSGASAPSSVRVWRCVRAWPCRQWFCEGAFKMLMAACEDNPGPRFPVWGRGD